MGRGPSPDPEPRPEPTEAEKHLIFTRYLVRHHALDDDLAPEGGVCHTGASREEESPSADPRIL